MPGVILISGTGIFASSSNELGTFESGVAGKIVGLVPSVVFGGFMIVAVVFTTIKINKPLRLLSLKREIFRT